MRLACTSSNTHVHNLTHLRAQVYALEEIIVVISVSDTLEAARLHRDCR